MSDQAISVLGSVSFAWLKQHGAAGYDKDFFLDPLRRLELERRAHQIVAERFPEDPVYNFEAHLVQVAGRRRPVALVGGLQPNLILGAAVGAELVFYGDKDPDITPTPLKGLESLDSLRAIDWKSRWPVSLFLEQITQTRAEFGADCLAIPPFFWDASGRATFHGIVTTALKLVGEDVFVDMVVRPDFVRELFEWIVDAYGELSELFAQAAGLAVHGAHIGDCSACMIGPEQYGEFILPPLRRLARRMGGLRLHSCGLSDHLLELFAQIEELNCLNVGSGTSVRAIRRLFGPKLRVDLIPPVELLTYGQPADVDRWVRQTLEENEGGPLEFQFHLDLGQREEVSLQIVRTLRELGHPCPREVVY